MPILGTISSSYYATIPTGFYSISTQTVGSGGASSISFNSIPQGYTHLQIRGYVKVGGNCWVSTQFNSDSAANYGYYSLRGTDGGNPAAATSKDNNWAYTAVMLNSTYNGSFVSDILNYTSTKRKKTIRTFAGAGTTTLADVGMIGNYWTNTSAITDIKIITDNGTSFQQYTKFALYGMK